MATAQGLLCSITTHQKKREKQKKILTDSSHARSGACGGGVQGEFGVRMRTALEILLHTLSSSGWAGSLVPMELDTANGQWAICLPSPTHSLASTLQSIPTWSKRFWLVTIFIYFTSQHFLCRFFCCSSKKSKREENNKTRSSVRWNKNKAKAKAEQELRADLRKGKGARGLGLVARVFAGKAEIADSAAAALQLKNKIQK